jgi:hypothetical protein
MPSTLRHVWTVTFRDPQKIAGSTVVHFLDDDGERAMEFAAAHLTVSVRQQWIPCRTDDQPLAGGDRS